MPLLEDFLRFGQLGPIVLGMEATAVIVACGDPDAASTKTNPLILKYGCVQLTFSRKQNQRAQTLRTITLQFQPVFDGFPKDLEFSDWSIRSSPTELEFSSFLQRIGYEPIQRLEGLREKKFVFPSNVVVLVSDGLVEKITFTERESTTPLSGANYSGREPSVEQIQAMLTESRLALESGAARA